MPWGLGAPTTSLISTPITPTLPFVQLHPGLLAKPPMSHCAPGPLHRLFALPDLSDIRLLSHTVCLF